MSNPASSDSSCDSLLSPNVHSASVCVLFDAENFDSSGCSLTEESIRHCCEAVLAAQSLIALDSVADIELSVQFVAPANMQALNLQYRAKDAPTNVLSFESGLPAFQLSDCADTGNMLALGDLVLCSDVVHEEAVKQGKPCDHHWLHLFVHGTLHLCGYDHENSKDAETMESLEIQILSDLGIPDPYDIIEKQ
ncbi:MAG: rRNA maturation RNase YbeY [Granulosicoccus sp.]